MYSGISRMGDIYIKWNLERIVPRMRCGLRVCLVLQCLTGIHTHLLYIHVYNIGISITCGWWICLTVIVSGFLAVIHGCGEHICVLGYGQRSVQESNTRGRGYPHCCHGYNQGHQVFFFILLCTHTTISLLISFLLLLTGHRTLFWWLWLEAVVYSSGCLWSTPPSLDRSLSSLESAWTRFKGLSLSLSLNGCWLCNH